MDDEPLQDKSELELKYKAALDAIAAGSSWEKVVANSVLNKKPGIVSRTFASLGRNLATITSLIVAVAGISFGILQYETGESQKRIAKVQALQQLIPSLTNEKAEIRGYALAALLTLYPSSSDPSSADNKELSALVENIGEVGDAETIEALAKRLKDDKLTKKAGELYAIRSEYNRHQSPSAKGEARENLLKAASSDATKALALDPENARAIYQVGRLLQDRGDLEDLKVANKKFDQVISLIEGKKYPRDTEIYLRSYLQKAVVLHELENRFSQSVCYAYKIAADHFREAGLDINWDQEAKAFKACQ